MVKHYHHIWGWGLSKSYWKNKLAVNLHLDTFLFLQLWSGVYYIAEEGSEDWASADSRESSNLEAPDQSFE